jgi:hypothetical protein
MSNNASIPISDNHRRAIVSALLLFDRMLCEVEEYAHGREVRSVFHVERNTLSEDRKSKLLAEVSQMRAVLQELKDGLGLEAEIEDVGRRIWGQGSTFWEVLVETKSRYLKGFGQVPPQLARYLDPRMDVLIQHLRNLTALALDGADGVPARGMPRQQDATG